MRGHTRLTGRARSRNELERPKSNSLSFVEACAVAPRFQRRRDEERRYKQDTRVRLCVNVCSPYSAGLPVWCVPPSFARLCGANRRDVFCFWLDSRGAAPTRPHQLSVRARLSRVCPLPPSSPPCDASWRRRRLPARRRTSARAGDSILLLAAASRQQQQWRRGRAAGSVLIATSMSVTRARSHGRSEGRRNAQGPDLSPNSLQERNRVSFGRVEPGQWAPAGRGRGHSSHGRIGGVHFEPSDSSRNRSVACRILEAGRESAQAQREQQRADADLIRWATSANLPSDNMDWHRSGLAVARRSLNLILQFLRRALSFGLSAGDLTSRPTAPKRIVPLHLWRTLHSTVHLTRSCIQPPAAQQQHGGQQFR